MINIILVILSFMLAIVGGTGLYMASPLLLNITILACIVTISCIWYHQYRIVGLVSFELDSNKTFILALYIFFLMANVLFETLFYTDFQFNTHEGVLREYADYFRGLINFLITATVFGFIKDSKFFTIAPLLCVMVILIGQYLEIIGVIDYKIPKRLDDLPPEEAIVSRPNGFTNANLTAALALVWLFVALESKISSSAIIKGLTFILTLTVCLLTQSRAALLFLTAYIIYKLIILRNFKFLFFLFVFGFIGFTLMLHLNYEIAQEIIDNFTSRADSNENSAVERRLLINYAIDNFLKSPIFGNGIYYSQKLSGFDVSAHNQILEVLANFGLIGFVVMTLVYITFYHTNSFLYLSLCIFPQLIFSHNFFDSFEYQIALAFAYTVSRNNINIEKNE